MSLKDIQLNNSLVAKWFPHQLVDLPVQHKHIVPAAAENAEPIAVTTQVEPSEAQPATSAIGLAQDSKTKTATDASAPLPSIPFMGKNQRKIGILIHEPNFAYLDDDDFGTLLKLMTACQLTRDDVAIINIAAHPHSFKTLQQVFGCHQWLLFGFDMVAKLRLPVLPYQTSTYHGSTILAGASFKEMAANHPQSKSNKTAWWQALKVFFHLV